jgi:hypothetical protein
MVNWSIFISSFKHHNWIWPTIHEDFGRSTRKHYLHYDRHSDISHHSQRGWPAFVSFAAQGIQEVDKGARDNTNGADSTLFDCIAEQVAGEMVRIRIKNRI